MYVSLDPWLYNAPLRAIPGSHLPRLTSMSMLIATDPD